MKDTYDGAELVIIQLHISRTRSVVVYEGRGGNEKKKEKKKKTRLEKGIDVDYLASFRGIDQPSGSEFKEKA